LKPTLHAFFEHFLLFIKFKIHYCLLRYFLVLQFIADIG
jgi:hypothetical protein